LSGTLSRRKQPNSSENQRDRDAPLCESDFSVISERMEKEKKQPELKTEPKPQKPESGGPKGLEPTRYNDWEIGGKCVDF